MYFAQYINKDGVPVFPIEYDDPKWKTNPPSVFASSEEKKMFPEQFEKSIKRECKLSVSAVVY